MAKIDFSIIIPVYNTERYIEETVESIIQQKNINLEIILVDDGSTDNSQFVCNKLESKYSNIRTVFQKNKGAPSARNAGFQLSRGKYIIYFDSDDVMIEDSLRKMLILLEKDNADLLISNYCTISATGKKIDSHVIKKFPNKKKLDTYMLPAYPCCKVYKREIIQKFNIKFDDVKIGQDLNFYLKYLLYSKKIVVLNEETTKYRILSNSISNKKDSRILDIVNSINSVISFYKDNSTNNCLLNYVYIVGLDNIVFQYHKLETIIVNDSMKQVEQKFREEIYSISNKIHISTLKELLTVLKIYIRYFKSYICIKQKKF